MNNLLILSPYHSGSHQAWSEGYQSNSNYNVQILDLPGRYWKWRMHGGSVTLANRFMTNLREQRLISDKSKGGSASLPEAIIATDMTDLTTFLALTRQETFAIPAALYMHENQLTYPLPASSTEGPMRRQKGERDLHYAFVNYASMMAADRIYFNSHYHLNSLCDELPRFLSHFPDYNEKESISLIQAKSILLPVGIDFARFKMEQRFDDGNNAPPLIIWNQRWEYDKNPAAFFEAIYSLKESGLPFRLAICGQHFRRNPNEFEEAKTRLSEHIIHFGFAEEDEYVRLLKEATVVISTADHEFFGISILEAIYCNTFPILPRDLSYPELVPKSFQGQCLYDNKEELLRILSKAISDPESAQVVAAELSRSVAEYDWRNLAQIYDDQFSKLASKY
jgi:glycosyltransferase involved in cell wall biosynthesis